MKKLMMIAAAMTIASGALASACTPVEDEDCSLVYKIKMSLTTTVAKSAKSSDGCASLCYRKKGKVTLQGYAYGCLETCNCEYFQSLDWALWDKKMKAYYVDTSYGLGEYEWAFLNVIGKKNKEVEGSFGLDTEAFIALGSGLGKLDSKVCIPKKISGYMAGYGYPQGCGTGSVCEPGDDVCAYAYDCTDYCDSDTDEEIDGSLSTVYYGKWSIAYNKSLSKKYAGTYDLEDKMPDYPEYYGCQDDDANSGSDTNDLPGG